MTLCFRACFFSVEWIPRDDSIRVDSELGEEFEVYIKDAPSRNFSFYKETGRLDHARFMSIVRRNCKMKSYSSSRQFCSMSKVMILSDCEMGI